MNVALASGHQQILDIRLHAVHWFFLVLGSFDHQRFVLVSEERLVSYFLPIIKTVLVDRFYGFNFQTIMSPVDC